MAERFLFRLPWMTSAPPTRKAEAEASSEKPSEPPNIPPSSSDAQIISSHPPLDLPSSFLAAATDIHPPQSLSPPKLSAPRSPAASPVSAAAKGKAPASPISSSRNGHHMRSPSRSLPIRSKQITSPSSSPLKEDSGGFIDALKVPQPPLSPVSSNSQKDDKSASSSLRTDPAGFLPSESVLDDTNCLIAPSPTRLAPNHETTSLSSHLLTEDSRDAPQSNDANNIEVPPPPDLPPFRQSDEHASDDKLELPDITRNLAFAGKKLGKTNVDGDKEKNENYEHQKRINKTNIEREKNIAKESSKEIAKEKCETKKKQATQEPTSHANNSKLHNEVKGDAPKLMSNIERKISEEARRSAVTLAGENTGAVMQIGSEYWKQHRIHRGYETNQHEIEEQREKTKAQEELANNKFINCNSQSVNNSILFGSTVQGRSPGVNLSFAYHLPSITSKSQVPISKKRCLRELFSESTDSEDEQEKSGILS